MIDIREHPDVIDAVNSVLNSGGVCELKIEHGGEHLAVLEIKHFRFLKAIEVLKK